MKPYRISILSFLLAASLVLLLGASASAEETAVQPQLPHTFYGSVEVAGSPAKAGISVEAAGIGVRSNITGNPVNTLPDGTYGKANFSSQTLVVQGNVAPGASLNFYVGGLLAEVYDVAAGGPWKETYPFETGGYTELNLRVASQPATGQTRVPTPTQTAGIVTNNQAGTSSSTSSSGTSSSGTASGGAALPQVPESQGQQTAGMTPQQTLSGNTQPGAAGQEQGVQIMTTKTTGAAPGNNPVSLAPTGAPPMYIAGAILIILIIAGGAYYLVYLNKNSADETKSEEVKEPEQKKD